MIAGLQELSLIVSATRIALLAVFLVWITPFAGCRSASEGEWSVSNHFVEPPAYATGDLILTGTLVTMDDELSVLKDSRIYIRSGRIAAITPLSDAIPPGAGGVPEIRTKGFIYPGLINAHNHLAYNVLPPWDMPRVNGQPFTNVYDWREGLGAYREVAESYRQNMTWPKSDLMDRGLAVEVGKWAEIKELVAGTTASQGSFSFRGRLESDEESSGFELHLARNIDLGNGGRTRQSSLGPYDRRYPHALNDALLEDVLRGIESGRTDAFLVHVSEGIDEGSREELYDLNGFHIEDGERCGPLLENTVVIHGTPYGPEEFALMAACGVDLIAAPLSNLLHYGQAPRLADAVEAGVRVSLSTDWGPVGSKNLLVELKVADFLNGRFYDRRLTDADLVRMVTSNPAVSAGWGERAGRLDVGFWGDLVVIDSSEPDPYRALIEATERDVALVVVGGEPLYGNPAILRALKPDDHEILETGCGFEKAIDITTDRGMVGKGRQTLGSIRQSLIAGFGTLEPGVRSRGLSPLFMCEDSIGLEAIRNSANLTHFDPELGEWVSMLESYYLSGSASPRRTERVADDALEFPQVTSDTGGRSLDLPSEPGTERVTAVVRRVQDGDTIFVEYPDGSTGTVRVRGIDAPEIVSQNDPARFRGTSDAACLDRWGRLAAQHAIDALTGQRVDLVTDSPPQRSALGLLLAYVHLAGEDFNARMVAQGYANVFTGGNPGSRVAEYLELQEKAQGRSTGLWEC